MATYSYYNLEIDDEVFKALKEYCDRETLSISEFIKANLEAIGEY